MNNHFFIVCSPLQLRIASIIKKTYNREDNKFHILYLKANSRMNNGVRGNIIKEYDSYCISGMDYGLFNFRSIMKFISKINGMNLFVYFANANDLTIHYILSNIKMNFIIRTFDDGILNINTIENINQDLKEKNKIKHKLTRFFYKNVFSIKKIIDESEVHYTILDYNRNLNIKSRLVKINLFDFYDKNESFQKTDVINIFIGSKFKDILRNENKEDFNLLMSKIKKISSKYANVIYLRHPRENLIESFSMLEKEVETISEDIIIDFINNGHSVNLIGFASTCQLNLMKANGVKITLLNTKLIRKDILESFSLFDNALECIVSDIDSW
ncbi:glycosyltransferase family 52 [Providencia huaxiensis]|uniref:glycosyltransferase family 52 n=1 Tax=Providencia huaxiensis TaxID=2027290 RepID=UPI0032D9F296